MAEEIQQERGFLDRGWSVVTAVYHAVFRDGTVDAFLRQGANELGAVFGKALPDSVQIDEPGAVFNPIYSDIAAEKSSHARSESASLPSPAEIAQESRGSVFGPERTGQETMLSPSEIGRDAGSIYGQALQSNDQSLPSPSQIANEQPSQAPEPQHGLEHERDRGGR
jgi:hypothetical protein